MRDSPAWRLQTALGTFRRLRVSRYVQRAEQLAVTLRVAIACQREQEPDQGSGSVRVLGNRGRRMALTPVGYRLSSRAEAGRDSPTGTRDDRPAFSSRIAPPSERNGGRYDSPLASRRLDPPHDPVPPRARAGRRRRG